jgi:hypothetical protein
LVGRRRQQKPKNVPSGTIPIEQDPELDHEDREKIKEGIGAGPKDWVGISPEGQVISGDEEGNAVDHRPKQDYLP